MNTWFEQLTVRFLEEDKFVIENVPTRLIIGPPDGPERPTDIAPLQAFVASLGASTGMYALRYLRSARVNPTGLGVDLQWTIVQDPRRIGAIKVRLQLPEGFPADNVDSLLRMVNRCTIHNTLRYPPNVSVSIVSPPVVEQLAAAA